MNEVICQTKFESPFGADDAGISVYIANLNAETEYTISIRIDDTVKLATISESDKTITDKVSFYGLRNCMAYNVDCIICSEEGITSLYTTMYARSRPVPFSFQGRPGGGALNERHITPKVEVL